MHQGPLPNPLDIQSDENKFLSHITVRGELTIRVGTVLDAQILSFAVNADEDVKNLYWVIN